MRRPSSAPPAMNAAVAGKLLQIGFRDPTTAARPDMLHRREICMNAGTTMHASALAPAEQDRADLYALVAALLLERADAILLQSLAEAPPLPADAPLAAAWQQLTDAARRCAASAGDEYDELFTATGNPQLSPYQCYYLAGCLMDRPLAELRSDLRALGLARHADTRELEDHLGALCEGMRLLVQRGAPHEQQREFFRRHLAGWSSACLHDMRTAPGADFYAAVAGFAEAFLALEREGFALEEHEIATVTWNHEEAPTP